MISSLEIQNIHKYLNVNITDNTTVVIFGVLGAHRLLICEVYLIFHSREFVKIIATGRNFVTLIVTKSHHNFGVIGDPLL